MKLFKTEVWDADAALAILLIAACAVILMLIVVIIFSYERGEQIARLAHEIDIVCKK